ncbi:endoribonuclease XendoU [Necator americanus]|uniref:Endoribonuclease XendoU n=1 Tax=Necator americanus TaxID=51031 RepID=W2SYW4_NECAM|nr:endoribonuclease XendoU [Necator americanus]ETN74875.1 endoribonuclease XendoU [Necator americanus]
MRDEADYEFFTLMDINLLQKPSYSLLVDMMNNYNPRTGIAEPRVSLHEEAREVNAFLDIILGSKPFQKLFEFLKRKEHPFASSERDFRRWIERLWFEQYSRSKGKLDTSGFEHVFMGEIKGNKVTGLHNWIRLYYLEKAEDFDYQGFIHKRGVCPPLYKNY